MPVLASVPPKCLVWILQQCGWVIQREDNFNWALTHPSIIPYIAVIPKLPGLIATELIEEIVKETVGDGKFIELKGKCPP
jgi:hypothetical protein